MGHAVYLWYLQRHAARPMNTEWQGVPLEAVCSWQKAFAETPTGYRVHAPCPVCKAPTLRRYFYLGRVDPLQVNGIAYQGRGSLWEWCATCRSFEHAQALVPLSWTAAPLQVDHAQLTPVPDLLDALIGEHAGLPR